MYKILIYEFLILYHHPFLSKDISNLLTLSSNILHTYFPFHQFDLPYLLFTIFQTKFQHFTHISILRFQLSYHKTIQQNFPSNNKQSSHFHLLYKSHVIQFQLSKKPNNFIQTKQIFVHFDSTPLHKFLLIRMYAGLLKASVWRCDPKREICI